MVEKEEQQDIVSRIFPESKKKPGIPEEIKVLMEVRDLVIKKHLGWKMDRFFAGWDHKNMNLFWQAKIYLEMRKQTELLERLVNKL